MQIKLEQFKNFFDTSEDVLCIAGFDGYFKYVNKKLATLLEYDLAELYSSPIDSFIHDEDVEFTRNYRKSIKANNKQLHFENRYKTKSGNILWFSWTAIPNLEENVVFAIAKNITHQKFLEFERINNLKNLESKIELIRQSSFSTSHDLRSPVNNILSLLSLIDYSKIVDVENNEILKLIYLNTESLKSKLEESVDKLIKTDKLLPDYEKINLELTLEKVKNGIQSILTDSHVQIQANFSTFNEIEYPKEYIESILLNLITNSVKYRKPDIPSFITIKTKIEENKKMICYEDNGLGFDVEKVKERILNIHQNFEHKLDSKGLGLYLVNKYIESLGGKFLIESQVNIGSKFTIIF